VTLLAEARRIADEVLFPAAAEVDRAPRVPVGQLELLAAAGLYGAAAPASVGGADLSLPEFGLVVEALAGGSLATAFVWAQHHGLVRTLAGLPPSSPLRADWLAALAAGACKAGAAYGGLLPGPPRLRATPNPAGGWVLSGESPWVTGWGLVDLLHVAARAPDGTVVWQIVDAVERPGLRATPLRTVAADAASTVRLEFAGLPVPEGRATLVEPYEVPGVSGPPLRSNGSLALGVAGRCVALLPPGRAADELAAELAACRAALDEAAGAGDPEAMPVARAAAAELAVRAAAALTVSTGAAAALAGSTADRLTREALFLLVFGSRPQIKTALLDRLAGLA
jgi:alkylation response protein AidB-like acyl-CoA dehydrogenase